MEISYGILSGLISMFSWGMSDFLAAKSSRKIGSILTLFWMKVFFVSIALISYLFLGFQTPDIESILKFLPIILLAGFLCTVASLAFFEGFIKGNVSIVSPVGASYACIIVLLSIMFFNEILKINQLVGIILIILGIPLISLNLVELLKIKKLNIFSGVKEGLLAMFGWGLSLFLIIPATRTIGWFFSILILNFSITLFLTIYLNFRKNSFRINFQSSTLILLLLIALSDMLAWFAYGFGVTKEYASLVAPISASFPLVTIVLARLFLRERLAFNQALGIAGVILGLILVSV